MEKRPRVLTVTDAGRVSPPSIAGLISGGVWHCTIALLAVTAGAWLLLSDSWRLGGAPSDLTLRAIFGLLLGSLVVARFSSSFQPGAPGPAPDMGLVCRELSRMVYLILYLAIGVQQLARLTMHYWPAAQHARSMPLQSADDAGQAFLLCGVCALLLIRVLVACGRLTPPLSLGHANLQHDE